MVDGELSYPDSVSLKDKLTRLNRITRPHVNLLSFYFVLLFSSFQLGNQNPAKKYGALISSLETLQPLLSLYHTTLALNYILPCNN